MKTKLIIIIGIVVLVGLILFQVAQPSRMRKACYEKSQRLDFEGVSIGALSQLKNREDSSEVFNIIYEDCLRSQGL